MKRHSRAHGSRVVGTMALVCLPAWLLAAATHAGPPAGEAPPAPEPSVAYGQVAKSRQSLEDAMSELGRLTADAETRSASDAQMSGCLLDKRDRGREVMELATTELLVVQDAGSTDQQKTFAAEKLEALSVRMDQLVEAARACGGDNGPEDDDDRTRNEADEPTTVPYADPTVGGGTPPVPPPVDDGRPPSVESPTG